ncbi:MAG: CPBP family intramembrane metalloprotease [Bacilli bacterium]|nr:CPBP family intramembrane metalloprotease [Bacilli bacterium]
MDIKDKYNYKSNTSGAIVWGASWPGGLYLAINFGLSFVLVFLLIFWIIINRSNEFEPGFIVEKVIQWSIPLTLAIQVITTVIYAIFYKKAVKECLPVVKQKTNWSMGIWSILLMLGVSSISSYILDFIQRFIPDFGSSYDSIVESMFSTALPLTVLSTVIMAPLCEELMMRGLTFNRLLSGVKKWPAILISAAIFGFIHLNLLQGLNAFVLGVVLAFTYYKTRSLLICMLQHGANNLLSVIGSYLVINEIGNYTLINNCLSVGFIVLGLISAYFFFKTKDVEIEKNSFVRQ